MFVKSWKLLKSLSSAGMEMAIPVFNECSNNVRKFLFENKLRTMLLWLKTPPAPQCCCRLHAE